MTHCAGCGYLREYHDLAGRCPGLTTKKFVVPAPVVPVTWVEILAADAARWKAEAEEARRPYVAPTVPAPLIPARAPQRAEEYATSNRGMSAGKIGRKAVELGWEAQAWYWMAHDGAEGCAIRLSKPPMHAVATWRRPPSQVGNLTGWTTELAYAWRSDIARFPTKLTHTELEGLIT